MSANAIQAQSSMRNTSYLGQTESGQPVSLADSELNQHCLIVGTTGAGKTNTILNLVKSALARNLPCIYLDGKGSLDLVDKLQQLARMNKRTFKVFSLRPNTNLSNPAVYNPFNSGNATEWKNRIMSLFAEAQGNGQEHFSLAVQNYINFVSHILYRLSIEKGLIVDLKIVLTFLENPDRLVIAARSVDPKIAEKLHKLHNDSSTRQMAGDVIKLLELFIYSSYGEFFDTTDKTNIINLRTSILNNELILFLFDASTYPEDTKKIAKMVINDINSCFSSFDKFTPALCVFDEFASYASSNLAETISLQRSQGMHAVVGTQSIATVKLKSSDSRRIAEELVACCNTFIIHALNHVEDAELFAKVIGIEDSMQYTTNIYDKELSRNTRNSDRAHVIASGRVVEKFKISPQQIKELKRGEAIIYRKVVNLPAQKVLVCDAFAMINQPIHNSKNNIKLAEPHSYFMHIIILISLGLCVAIAWKIYVLKF